MERLERESKHQQSDRGGETAESRKGKKERNIKRDFIKTCCFLVGTLLYPIMSVTLRPVSAKRFASS